MNHMKFFFRKLRGGDSATSRLLTRRRDAVLPSGGGILPQFGRIPPPERSQVLQMAGSGLQEDCASTMTENTIFEQFSQIQ